MNTTLKKAKTNFEKNLFKLMSNLVFWKNYGKCEKTYKYQTCNNRKEKKLSSVRTKLSYYKVLHKKFIRNKTEKNTDTYE